MQRREVLKAGLAGSLFLPQPWAWVWAQSDSKEGALKLLKAPKLALVVGNGKYKDAPELKNAPNDAKAIAEVLKASGFAVAMHLDTARDVLVQAIRDYVNTVEKQKAVGLFYFAGHGVQLDWRNYMLPIDAVIDKIEDVARQSVDIARLMEGLTKAANPMNVIILDACRENPFGESKKPAQQGLSQMDAPVQTLLAYATSPGNVASDGDGANGLYTENLLREMKVPEAKIEDVFKRARLAVRRTSKGAQIPWESTSLEDDFWFLPPKELKKISDAEKERLFKEELALWEKAQATAEQATPEKAAEPGPLEEYLRRYPSGNFTELAQLRLERLLARQGEKKIEIASQQGNPYSKGSFVANTLYKVGDSYVYSVQDLYSKVEQERSAVEITRITDELVYFSNGRILDLLGNLRRNRVGAQRGPNQLLPLEYTLGKRWRTQFITTHQDGEVYTTELEGRITARENITVVAGTFDAFRLEYQGYSNTRRGVRRYDFTTWRTASVRVSILLLDKQTLNGRSVVAERQELLSFKET